MVARESTRLTCAAVNGAQTSLDPRQLRNWMPNMVYGGHAFGFRKEGQDRKAEFEEFLQNREKVLPWIREYSPFGHVTPGDPPLFLAYPSQDKPPVQGEEQKDPTHSAVMGVMLKRRMERQGNECRLVYPGVTDPMYGSVQDFLVKKLKGA